MLLSTYLYFTLDSISRGRACIFVVFSLLIVDCFGLCAMVVSLIEGFFALNIVSSILYHFVHFVFLFDHCSLIFKLKTLHSLYSHTSIPFIVLLGGLLVYSRIILDIETERY